MGLFDTVASVGLPMSTNTVSKIAAPFGIRQIMAMRLSHRDYAGTRPSSLAFAEGAAPGACAGWAPGSAVAAPRATGATGSGRRRLAMARPLPRPASAARVEPDRRRQYLVVRCLVRAAQVVYRNPLARRLRHVLWVFGPGDLRHAGRAAG